MIEKPAPPTEPEPPENTEKTEAEIMLEDHVRGDVEWEQRQRARRPPA